MMMSWSLLVREGLESASLLLLLPACWRVTAL